MTQLADMRQLLKRVALEGRERVAYELEKRVSSALFNRQLAETESED